MSCSLCRSLLPTHTVSELCRVIANGNHLSGPSLLHDLPDTGICIKGWDAASLQGSGHAHGELQIIKWLFPSIQRETGCLADGPRTAQSHPTHTPPA